MQTYIALLRGINVSGQKLIKMDQLREVLSKIGLENVRTYIQSGNILFESPIQQTSYLSTKIAHAITENFSFDVVVITFGAEILPAVISNNPFTSETGIDLTPPYVAFLSEIPESNLAEAFGANDFTPDRCRLIGNIVYINYDTSASKSKLTNNLIEKKLKTSATTRNWNTVLKLAELSS